MLAQSTLKHTLFPYTLNHNDFGSYNTVAIAGNF